MLGGGLVEMFLSFSFPTRANSLFFQTLFMVLSLPLRLCLYSGIWIVHVKYVPAPPLGSHWVLTPVWSLCGLQASAALRVGSQGSPPGSVWTGVLETGSWRCWIPLQAGGKTQEHHPDSARDPSSLVGRDYTTRLVMNRGAIQYTLPRTSGGWWEEYGS